MNNAELYHRSNILQKRDALACLEEYGKRIKWKNGRITIIDIGCGDGSVTMSILRNYIPNDFVKLIGCDISEKMIQFANERYASDQTSFMVLDIEGDLPNELRGNFDHAFSFYTLHWIKHQEVAFTNIYDLLKIGGECLLLLLGHMPVFDVYRILSRSTKWKFWLKDAERFISPYHDYQDPEKEVKRMMTSIGFTSVEVECLKKSFVYSSLDALKVKMGKRKDNYYTKKCNNRFKKRISSKNVTENHLQSTNETTKDDVVLKNTECDQESVICDKEFAIDGNRIVDFGYLFTQLLDISNHNSAFGCNLSCLKMTKEIKKGFLSKFCFTCRMCNEKFELNNCKDPGSSTELNINDFAVSGFISIGAGYSGLEQVSASLNIPCMSDKLYAKCHKKICDLWELAKEKSMEEAAKEEYRIAVLNNEVDANGIPMITVVADACWSKRSYRKNYNALSGAAVIIGYRTKKVLYMAVKNKYCMVCARAENKNKPIPDHICFKNYTGSSSGMESTALVEGFKTSVETHGLIYSKLIADGDASTYSKIEKAKPYGNLLVEKIECTNHLLRNYCAKLDDLAKNTRYPLKYRKAVQNNILRFRRSVTGAVKHISGQENKNFQQKVIELKQDLLNAPHHVFGNHSSCKIYYCKKLSSNDASTEENLVPAMKSTEGGYIFIDIMKCTYRLVNNATSLMHNVNSNIAEIFNSVIAKFIGGKRINYSTRQSYGGRCAASVVSFNSGQPQTFLSKKILLRSPNKIIKRLENRRELKRFSSVKRKLNKTFTVKPQYFKNDKNYGESCEKPDLSEADYEFAKNEHLKNISLSAEDRNLLERRTILQGESVEWRQERKLRLTASTFGRVCKRGLIKCGPLVKDLVAGKNLDHVKSIQYGKTCEHLARDQLENILEKPITRCGLFIDPELPFLGASPDGLVGEEIVEIKCPYSAKGMSVDDGIKMKKINFWKVEKNGTVKLDKKHNWYYQAQGQIHVTRRKTCIFAVWTDVDMKIEIIQEDKAFWNEMENKLTRFYFDCLLPEIIDSRLDRQMEIKEPDYILNAIKEREIIKKRKATKEEVQITKINKKLKVDNK